MTLGAIAGMKHGALYSPWRRLPAYAEHVTLGAEMREYGGWWRPACYKRGNETPAQAVQWFGTLHATLPPECLPTPVRLRMLWAYRRVLKSSGAKSLPRFGAFVRCISDSAKAAAKRSSVRQQLGAPSANPQRLVWLDGEAAVAIPGVAAHWHNGPTGEPFYDRPSGGESLARSDGTTGELTRFHTFAPLGLARAALRERPWRSPGATAARVLFHLERFGIPGPKLLAFGQRSARRCSVQSFVLTSPLGAAVTNCPSNPPS